MNAMPTLEGGLRIDAVDSTDWLLLSAATDDAVSGDVKLAQRLGDLITDREVAADWQEFIVPDLDEGFSADIVYVATRIAAARVETGGGPGPLWITPEDAAPWYSTLNQARLALEERYDFGPGESIDLAALSVDERSGFFRSQFYCGLQSLLLEHVMC